MKFSGNDNGSRRIPVILAIQNITIWWSSRDQTTEALIVMQGNLVLCNYLSAQLLFFFNLVYSVWTQQKVMYQHMLKSDVFYPNEWFPVHSSGRCGSGVEWTPTTPVVLVGSVWWAKWVWSLWDSMTRWERSSSPGIRSQHVDIALNPLLLCPGLRYQLWGPGRVFSTECDRQWTEWENMEGHLCPSRRRSIPLQRQHK